MSKKGLLIYNQIDYEKNKWFASELITQAAQHQLELTLVLKENLLLTIEENSFKAYTYTESGLSPIQSDLSQTQSDLSPTRSDLSPTQSDLSPTRSDLSQIQSDLSQIQSDLSQTRLSPISADLALDKTVLSPGDVDFVINRTRDSLVGTHFEKMGCRVFNSSTVTEICNHKGKTHQMISSAGIASVKTLLGSKSTFNPVLCPFAYPVILKSVGGHGGSEVYKVHTLSELQTSINSLESEAFILQEICSQPGIDVRVFTLGKEIIAAVKRSSTESFKSNYSLGGKAHAYTLTEKEEALVKRILNLLDFDFVGIDFILDQEGQFLFNEIEDVVGTRTLYLNYNFDIITLFIEYISSKLNSTH